MCPPVGPSSVQGCLFGAQVLGGTHTAAAVLLHTWGAQFVDTTSQISLQQVEQRARAGRLTPNLGILQGPVRWPTVTASPGVPDQTFGVLPFAIGYYTIRAPSVSERRVLLGREVQWAPIWNCRAANSGASRLLPESNLLAANQAIKCNRTCAGCVCGYFSYT